MYGLGYDIEVISGLRLAEAKFTASQNIHGETGNFPRLAGGWAGLVPGLAAQRHQAGSGGGVQGLQGVPVPAVVYIIYNIICSILSILISTIILSQ